MRSNRIVWTLADTFAGVDVATFHAEHDAIELARAENTRARNATGLSGPRFQVERSHLVAGRVV